MRRRGADLRGSLWLRCCVAAESGLRVRERRAALVTAIAIELMPCARRRVVEQALTASRERGRDLVLGKGKSSSMSRREVDGRCSRPTVLASTSNQSSADSSSPSRLENAPRDDRGERLVDRLGRHERCACMNYLHLILLGSVPNQQTVGRRSVFPDSEARGSGARPPPGHVTQTRAPAVVETPSVVEMRISPKRDSISWMCGMFS